jgi:hypothetical protein
MDYWLSQNIIMGFVKVKLTQSLISYLQILHGGGWGERARNIGNHLDQIQMCWATAEHCQVRRGSPIELLHHGGAVWYHRVSGACHWSFEFQVRQPQVLRSPTVGSFVMSQTVASYIASAVLTGLSSRHLVLSNNRSLCLFISLPVLSRIIWLITYHRCSEAMRSYFSIFAFTNKLTKIDRNKLFPHWCLFIKLRIKMLNVT